MGRPESRHHFSRGDFRRSRIYELARIFTNDNAHAVGERLFACLLRFLDAGIACSVEVRGLVIRECQAFEMDQPEISFLLDSKEYDVVKREVGKLADGVVEGVVKGFVEKRTKAASEARSDQRDHFIDHEALRTKLKSINATDLPTWLETETLSPYGTEVFYQHLKSMLTSNRTGV
jgi:hypothetical protein